MLTRRLAKPMGPRCSRQVASHASHQLIRVMHTGGARSTHRRLPLGVAVHPACASRAVREAAAAGKVGEVIRLVRRAHGLSQRQLGATTGRSQSTISRIERGGPGTRDVATLRQLGSELGIAPVLLGLAEYSNQDKHSTRTSEPPVYRRNFVFRAAPQCWPALGWLAPPLRELLSQKRRRRLPCTPSKTR